MVVLQPYARLVHLISPKMPNCFLSLHQICESSPNFAPEYQCTAFHLAPASCHFIYKLDTYIVWVRICNADSISEPILTSERCSKRDSVPKLQPQNRRLISGIRLQLSQSLYQLSIRPMLVKRADLWKFVS